MPNCNVRISREYQDMLRLKDENERAGICAYPITESDLTKWTAKIKGPENTPYENGVFELLLEFRSNYPFKPPKVTVLTEIFHPNIYNKNICLDLLRSQWTPALNISRLLVSIQSLLDDPNPDDPLNVEAGNLCRDDPEAFAQKAREYTIRYALPKTE